MNVLTPTLSRVRHSSHLRIRCLRSTVPALAVPRRPILLVTSVNQMAAYLGGSSCMGKNGGKGRKMTGFQRHRKIVVLLDIFKSVANKYGGLNISIRMMCPMGETGKSIVW